MAHDLIFGKTKRDWSCGSLLIPAKQEKALLNKIDDVRYDIRKTGNVLKIGLLSLSAALGFIAVSSIYRTRSDHQR
jgi:hypothetical protein